MALRIAVLMMGLMVFCHPVNSQIKNKYDIHFNSGQLLTKFHYPKFFINELGHEMPTILGNIKNVNSLNAGLLFSRYSYYFQPKVTFNYTIYRPNKLLKEKFAGIDFKSFALGVGGKVNLFKYGSHIITPYLYFNLGYEYNQLTQLA